MFSEFAFKTTTTLVKFLKVSPHGRQVFLLLLLSPAVILFLQSAPPAPGVRMPLFPFLIARVGRAAYPPALPEKVWEVRLEILGVYECLALFEH